MNQPWKIIVPTLILGVLLGAFGTNLYFSQKQEVIEEKLSFQSDNPQNKLFEYSVKTEDDSCPETQKMSYSFNGAESVETGCKDIAFDAGKICKNDDDCVNNCFVSRTYLDQLGYESNLCFGEKEYPNIQGRCEAIMGEAQVTLPENNTVRYFCDE